MSAEILVQLGSKGADTIIKAAKDALDKVSEQKGKDQAIAFPQTNYYFPLANALLKIEAKSLADCRNILTQTEALNNNQPSANGLKLEALGGVLNKGIATLLCEEVLAALQYLSAAHPQKECAGFLSDTLLRS